MTIWLHHFRVQDIFHNYDLTLEQKRDEIVRRLKASRFYNAEDDQLTDAVDAIAQATTTAGFDESWDAFYDWADWNRVWVVTR